MGFFRRIGYSLLIILVGIFVIIVSAFGYIRWLFTGKSLTDFASKVVYKITKLTKDVI